MTNYKTLNSLPEEKLQAQLALFLKENGWEELPASSHELSSAAWFHTEVFIDNIKRINHQKLVAAFGHVLTPTDETYINNELAQWLDSFGQTLQNENLRNLQIFFRNFLFNNVNPVVGKNLEDKIGSVSGEIKELLAKNNPFILKIRIPQTNKTENLTVCAWNDNPDKDKMITSAFWTQNQFHFMREVCIKQADENRRFDFVLFFNGIPIVIIETKRANFEHKFTTQLDNYETLFSKFFSLPQLLIGIDTQMLAYRTPNPYVYVYMNEQLQNKNFQEYTHARNNMWNNWNLGTFPMSAEPFDKTENSIHFNNSFWQDNQTETSNKTWSNCWHFLSKQNLIAFILIGVFFDYKSFKEIKNTSIIVNLVSLRNYQWRAVSKIKQIMLNEVSNQSHHELFINHHQGTGKSKTMLCALMYFIFSLKTLTKIQQGYALAFFLFHRRELLTQLKDNLHDFIYLSNPHLRQVLIEEEAQQAANAIQNPASINDLIFKLDTDIAHWQNSLNTNKIVSTLRLDRIYFFLIHKIASDNFDKKIIQLETSLHALASSNKITPVVFVDEAHLTGHGEKHRVAFNNLFRNMPIFDFSATYTEKTEKASKIIDVFKDPGHLVTLPIKYEYINEKIEIKNKIYDEALSSKTAQQQNILTRLKDDEENIRDQLIAPNQVEKNKIRLDGISELIINDLFQKLFLSNLSSNLNPAQQTKAMLIAENRQEATYFLLSLLTYIQQNYLTLQQKYKFTDQQLKHFIACSYSTAGLSELTAKYQTEYRKKIEALFQHQPFKHEKLDEYIYDKNESLTQKMIKRFKKHDQPPYLLIAVNRYTVGFDNPLVNTIYLDQVIFNEVQFFQTVCRANRKLVDWDAQTNQNLTKLTAQAFIFSFPTLEKAAWTINKWKELTAENTGAAPKPQEPINDQLLLPIDFLNKLTIKVKNFIITNELVSKNDRLKNSGSNYETIKKETLLAWTAWQNLINNTCGYNLEMLNKQINTMRKQFKDREYDYPQYNRYANHIKIFNDFLSNFKIVMKYFYSAYKLLTSFNRHSEKLDPNLLQWQSIAEKIKWVMELITINLKSLKNEVLLSENIQPTEISPENTIDQQTPNNSTPSQKAFPSFEDLDLNSLNPVFDAKPETLRQIIAYLAKQNEITMSEATKYAKLFRLEKIKNNIFKPLRILLEMDANSKLNLTLYGNQVFFATIIKIDQKFSELLEVVPETSLTEILSKLNINVTWSQKTKIISVFASSLKTAEFSANPKSAQNQQFWKAFVDLFVLIYTEWFKN